MSITKQTKKILGLLWLFYFFHISGYAQRGLGTNSPESSAILELKSTTKGFLLPRLTELEVMNISNPEVGLLVYCTTTKSLVVFNGFEWQKYDNRLVFDRYGTIYKEVISPNTGRVWLDRNLGASRVAQSATDSEAYGGLFQWGRNSDGHEERANTSFTSGQVNAGNEGTVFIKNENGDWLITRDDIRWNGEIKGDHDPCPMGFRVPSEAEWTEEYTSWSSQNISEAFSSFLRLTAGGGRIHHSASIEFDGQKGYYWSSTIFASESKTFFTTQDTIVMSNFQRGSGYSIRCIKE